MKWEYFRLKISEYNRKGGDLNTLGQEGWELVTIFNGVAYFKRAIKEEKLSKGEKMKWEYLVLPIADSEVSNQIKLMQHLYDSTAVHYPTINELGQEGWELVSIDNGIAYFKRAIESDIGISEEIFNTKVAESIQRMMK